MGKGIRVHTCKASTLKAEAGLQVSGWSDTDDLGKTLPQKTERLAKHGGTHL